MKVWKDIISGDEMLSDSFPMVFPDEFNGEIIKAQAKFITKKENESYGISANTDEGEEEAAADDKSITVIDIVDSLRLKEIFPDKAGFMGMVKEYLKRTVGEESSKWGITEENKVAFQKSVSAFVKYILTKFSECQFFIGENENWDQFPAISFTEDGNTDPSFFYLNRGLKPEKYWLTIISELSIPSLWADYDQKFILNSSKEVVIDQAVSNQPIVWESFRYLA